VPGEVLRAEQRLEGGPTTADGLIAGSERSGRVITVRVVCGGLGEGPSVAGGRRVGATGSVAGAGAIVIGRGVTFAGAAIPSRRRHWSPGDPAPRRPVPAPPRSRTWRGSARPAARPTGPPTRGGQARPLPQRQAAA